MNEEKERAARRTPMPAQEEREGDVRDAEPVETDKEGNAALGPDGRAGQAEEKEKALCERERALAVRERRFKARARILEKGLPEEAAELVDVSDDAACEKTLAALEKLAARLRAFGGAPTVAEAVPALQSYEERVRQYLRRFGRYEG